MRKGMSLEVKLEVETKSFQALWKMNIGFSVQYNEKPLEVFQQGNALT